VTAPAGGGAELLDVAARVAPELLDLDGLDLDGLAHVCAASLVSIAADVHELVTRTATAEASAAHVLDQLAPLLARFKHSKLARLL
jgi:hypothetical protein